MNILFLGKKNDYNTDLALDFCKQNAHVEECLGKWKDPLPEGVEWWRGEYLISYLSRWIVPQFLIDRASKGAINFHPGSTEYPGVGCVNFALYDNSPTFGVTCHYLAHPVDSGKIIRTQRFLIFPNDDVSTLLERTHAYLLTMFYNVMSEIFLGIPLMHSFEKWEKQAYTRKQLNDLAEITGDMTEDEIIKRSRACVYGDYGLTFKGRKLGNGKVSHILA